MKQKTLSRSLALVIAALLALTLLPTALAGGDVCPYNNGQHVMVTDSSDPSREVCANGCGFTRPRTPTQTTEEGTPTQTTEEEEVVQGEPKCTHAHYKKVRSDVGDPARHRLICPHCGVAWSWEAHSWQQVGAHYECVCGASTENMTVEQAAEALKGLIADGTIPGELTNNLTEEQKELLESDPAALLDKPLPEQPAEQPAAPVQEAAVQEAPVQEAAVQESSGQTTIPADSIPNEDVLSKEDLDRFEAERNHCYCDDPYTGERRRCD